MTTREDYEIEMKRHAIVLQGFVSLPEDEIYELPDETFDHIEMVADRAEAVSQILDAIDAAVAQYETEQTRHDLIPGVGMSELAQKSTLELLNLAARHLSARDVAVVIEQPYRKDFEGLCTWNAPGAKSAVTIRIAPDKVFYGDEYLGVFLHEVAHARLHTDYERSQANAWKMERDAKQQADYWTLYARTHANPNRYAGEGAPAARQFRSKLITLIASQEAAETIGTY
jgi:hypothetical protein